MLINKAISKTIWRKIKSLFSNPSIIDGLNSTLLKDSSPSSTFKDWLKAIDFLTPMIHRTRQDLDVAHFTKGELELLRASTYLYHLDRILGKTREHFITYHYHQDQFDFEKSSPIKPEFVQVQQSCLQCYNTILNLTQILKVIPARKLYSDEFIAQIHALELETTTLGSAIRALNQLAYRQEVMEQMDAFEKSLIQTLNQSRMLDLGNEYTALAHYLPNAEPPSQPNDIRRKMSSIIVQSQHLPLLNEMIDIYEGLKKCYVVARKASINDSLNKMLISINGILDIFAEDEIDKELAFIHLREMFYQIETLRFCSNRDSRCSRNLFDRAKWGKHQLRRACAKDSIGQEFIKQVAVKRKNLLRK